MADDAMGMLEDLDLSDFSPEDIMAAKQKILDMLESQDISEEEKENMRALLAGSLPLFGSQGSVSGTLLGLGFALLIFSVIFFFGYKLYKSIKEKEKKKEEKKKAKQMKKKK